MRKFISALGILALVLLLTLSPLTTMGVTAQPVPRTLTVVSSAGTEVVFPASGCDDPSKVTSVPIDTASSGNVELVALTASQTVFVCGYDVQAHGTVSVQFIYGTGAACGSGETNLTGVYSLQAREGLVRSNGGAVQFKGLVSNAVCIELSDAIQVSGVLTYVKEVP